MRGRALLFLFAVVPGIIQAACSASNGDSIGGDVRDAEPLDAVSGGGGDRDVTEGSDGSNDSGGTKDTGAKDSPSDSPKDVGPDGPSASDVRINEVYFVSGSNNEYVELRGPAGAPLDTLLLRFVDNQGKTIGPFTVGGPGDVMPGDGHWVVGGALVNNVDQIHLITGMNGWDVPNDLGAVQLYVIGQTSTLDVVGYTNVVDGGPMPAPSTDPKATVEGKPATSPTMTSQSLSRQNGAADTNMNSADFSATTASPGQ